MSCSLLTYISYTFCIVVLFISSVICVSIIYVINHNSDSIDFEQFYAAVQKNNTWNTFLMLCRYRRYINRFHQNGYTPFMMACIGANTHLITVMLRLGADINMKSKFGETPFYLAAYGLNFKWEKSHEGCLKALYEAGANIDEPFQNLSPLQTAALHGNARLTKWLIRKKANYDRHPRPFYLARDNGHIHTAKVIKDTARELYYENY